MTTTAPTILIVAAGTGGHIIPGIELGREFGRRGWRVEYACGNRAVEARIYDAAGIAPRVIGWPGAAGSLAGRVGRAARLAVAGPRAMRLVAAVRPAVVVSMGGGFSSPIILAAAMRGIPVHLHESNAIPGRVTRLFRHLARHVFLGLPLESAWPNAALVGTPTRPMPGWNPDHARVLVMGGSQGAVNLNRIAAEAARLARASEPALAMTILGDAPSAGDDPGIERIPHVPNPAELMAASTLIVSRAGASSLAEIAGVGMPSILVPYPHSKDGHQDANADVFRRAGASVVRMEADLTPDWLAREMLALVRDPARAMRMAQAAATLSSRNAATTIATTIEGDLARVASAAGSIRGERTA